MLEKRFRAVPVQSFAADGTTAGIVTVPDTSLFKVKQQVIVAASTLPNLDQLEVKDVFSPTQMVLGPRTANITTPQDLSAYTVALGANVFANEQKRPQVPSDDFERACYEEEPTVAKRTILVDKFGNKIDSRLDNNGVNRLAVDGQFTAEVDVQVDVDIEGEYNASTNPDPDSIGLIGHTRSNPTNQTHQVQRQTAKRGTVDTDTVSADVSLHDQNGNAYTPLNPIPVSGSYEKFFAVIAASKWMDLATYDEIVPTFSVGDTTLTLDYFEDGALLGQAVITNFTSSIGWQIKLNRYIDDDDGTILQDDDGSSLNLD